jgi:aminodeoxyfutalosine deaminase
VAAELLNLAEDGLAELARGSVRQSFADDPTKRRILAEIDDYAGGRIG